jgi:hypothetical protein
MASSSQYSLRFNNDIEDDDIGLIAIDDIWKATCDEISARWLGTLDTPIAAQIALCKVKKMAAWSIVNHDGIPGLNIPSIQEEALERYIPDEEPIPSTIDQWARGTVPTRKQKEEISLFPIKSSGSATPSVSSMRSSNTAKTGTSKGSKYSKSSYRSEGGTKVSRLEDQDMTGQIIELDDPDGEFGDLNANGALFDMLKKQQRQIQNGNKKEIIAEDKFNVMQAQIDKAKEELKKGKKVPKFTIDKEGILTKIVPVKPEGLPPFSVPLGLSISAAREVDKRPGSRPSTKASADANDGDVKRKKKVVKVVGARAIDESYFIASHTLATTLSGVDNISLVSPGVSVYDGNNKREGQPIPEDPKRQSRKQYLSRSQVLNGAGEGSMLDSRGGLGSPSFGGLDGESTEFNNSFIGLPASMSNFSLKDMNAFEGGRQIIRETGPSVSDDFYGDVEIGQQVPSVLPTKPSGKQKLNIDLLSGGTTKGRPRERETLAVAMPLTSSNKHLPAPAPGLVVGHGFKTSPEKDKSKVLGGSSVLNRSQVSQGANIIKKDNPNLARALSYNN